MPSNSSQWNPWEISAKDYCDNLNDSTKATLGDWSSEFMSMMIGFHVYYYIIIVTGGVGNTLIIYIYGRKSQKTPAAKFILFLAMSDLFVCLVVTPLSLHEVYSKFTAFNEPACAFYEYLHHMSQAVSVLTLLCIACDRYIGICKPLHYALHSYRAKYMMVLIVLAGCLLETPILFLAGLDRATLPDGLLGCICYWKEEYAGTYVYLIFQSCQLAMQLSTGVCICVMYILVYLVVRGREEKRRQDHHFELGGESIIGVQPITHIGGNDHVTSDTIAVAPAADAECGTNNDVAAEDHQTLGETRHETTPDTRGDDSAILTTHNGTTTSDVQGDSNGKGQESIPTAAEVKGVFNIAPIGRIPKHRQVLENVKEDSKGEEEEMQKEESNSSSSSEGSCDSKSALHLEETVKEETGTGNTADSPEAPDISPDTPIQQLHVSRSLVLQSTRVHPIERCTSLDKPTAKLLRLRTQTRLRSRFKTAKMLVTVTVVFFVTWIPYWIITLVVYFKPEFYTDKAAWELNIIKILRHFYLVNNATNPFIYTFVCKQFRDELKEMFSCSKFRKCRKW